MCRADEIPLTKYLLGGDTSHREQDSPIDSSSKSDPLAMGGPNALPVGFRISVKAKMNPSQLQAITASAQEYGAGGFTLIKGPPGTVSHLLSILAVASVEHSPHIGFICTILKGKSTTLVSVLNALHLRQYQEYYTAIERIVTESDASTYYEELAALNKASEVKPRILVCAPSNSAIDNVVMKIMTDRFVDGNGAKYSPSIVRAGVGIVNPAVKKVGLKQTVDAIISSGTDVVKLDALITTGRKQLKRMQTEIQKLKARVHALLESCPYPICEDWEVRIDEASFDSTGRVVFVNHKTKTTTFDIPPKYRPHEKPIQIKRMPHYIALLKNLTKYVERHNNETLTLEKYIILQNAANTRREGGGIEPSSSLVHELETHVLNSNHIILSTLGSAGGRSIEAASKFKVIVIDEAAQSAEPSTLVALQLGSSHAILVGDPQQLPATIFSVSGRSTKYDRSLFQRLEECRHPVMMLNTQYRMHPIISEFPRHIFYEGMLLDGPNVQKPDFGGTLKTAIVGKFPHIKPFNIFDLDSKEERDGTSLSNTNEAQLALHLYCALDRETNGLLAKSRVAVITPYSQQTALLHRLFEEQFGNAYSSRVEIRYAPHLCDESYVFSVLLCNQPLLNYPRITFISTVDAFQGREAGLVIYSCVRAAGSKGIGFLSDVQRMNVALTRAKYFLFVIARCRSIMVNPYWRNLVGYAREKSAIIAVPMDRRNSNKGNQFPDLKRLTPLHNTGGSGDISDGDCSA